MRVDGARNRLNDSRDPTVDTVWTKLHNRAERIKQQELDEAISRLETHGELTPDQRDVLVRMATEITETIITPPDTPKETNSRRTFDGESLIRLFDLRDDER